MAVSVAALLLILLARPAEAYIGPGAGFAVLGSFLAVVAGVVLGGIALVTWPIRLALRARRRGRRHGRSHAERVIVIGFDGMDPQVAEELMAAGRLPHLSKLRAIGTYAALATSCPPLSPVAWSSFMTGVGPGRHGIFDFLHRDPQTYLPVLSSAHVRPISRILALGPLHLPLGKPTLEMLRRSKPFWAVLGENGISSTVLRVPITFPAEPFSGLLLSGMCVPDLRGSQGSFTFFTSERQALDSNVTRQEPGPHRMLEGRNGCLIGTLPGPSRLGSQDPSELTLRLKPLDGASAVLELDGQRTVLRRGEYSEWLPVSFRLAPGLRAAGICRFLLKQVAPETQLYVSPINIDPARPALPIAHPPVYSVYLAKKHGRFGTLGLAEDTWALNEGVLDEAAFLRQCELFFKERRSILLDALANTRRGCLACVFDTTDRVQHMFWRYRELDHPGRTGEETLEWQQAIPSAYEQADALVGEVLGQLSERDWLLVISDHGFKSFRRGVNLNAWLLQNGYLRLKPGATGNSEWLRDVDWAETRAYAMGLSGLYLNLRGREAHGIVAPDEAAALRAELAARLTGLPDDDGRIAVARVLETAVVSPGPYLDRAPDLVVGYAPGYRISWEAAQGRVAGAVMSDNTRRWSGDHCFDPSQVPGVLFCNRPLAARAPRITDLAPTVLALFGLQAPAYMQGRSLLDADG